MKNPSVSIENNLVIIRRHKHHVTLELSADNETSASMLTCCFLEQDGKEASAAVLAPLHEQKMLVGRITSYLSAYLLIPDIDQLETDILQGIHQLSRLG